MPSYSYKAFDSEGSIQSGFINADSERSARKEIKSLNLIPHKLKTVSYTHLTLPTKRIV